jgi:hypothetical protein
MVPLLLLPGWTAATRVDCCYMTMVLLLLLPGWTVDILHCVQTLRLAGALCLT